MSNIAINTEFQKIRQPKPAEESEITVSEDRLREELYKQKVETPFIVILKCDLQAIIYQNPHISLYVQYLFFLTGSGHSDIM